MARKIPESSSPDLWPTHGRLAVRWIEKFLIHGEGDFFGKPFKLLPSQKLFLYRWYEYHPKTGLWRYRRALKGEPKGGGKTEFVAAIGALEYAGPPEIAPASPLVQIAAASYDQADEVFRAVGTMLGGQKQVVTEAPLRRFFDVFDSEVQFTDGRPGKIERVAAAAGTNDGAKPTLFIADELHEWTGNKVRVHTVIANGVSKRRNARILNISTAGAGRGAIPPAPSDSLLWKMYAEGKMQQADPTLSPDLLFDWQEASEEWDLDDEAQRELAIREASPDAADVLWDTADRVRRYDDPTVPRHEYRRYFLNQWVDVLDDNWLSRAPGVWDTAKSDIQIPERAPVKVGVDMALRHDSVAVTLSHRLADGRSVWRSRVFTADQSGRIDHVAVWHHIKSLPYTVECVVYDPRFFELPARMLEEEGYMVIEMPQSPERMGPAADHTYQRVLDAQILHDGDPILRSHVNNAVWREGERGRTLSKSKSGGHIDALIAGVMAEWEHDQPSPPPQAPPGVIDLHDFLGDT